MAEEGVAPVIVGTTLAFIGIFALDRLAGGPSRRLPLSDIVNPSSVASLAHHLSASTEEEFVVKAWRIAGEEIRYEPVGSSLVFTDHSVLCKKCLIPSAVLARGIANCVGKSALLASLMRNRIPSERVVLAIGELRTNSGGGHAWVLYKRADGDWYVLEATRPPSTWVKASSMAAVYVPEVVFNDKTYTCDNPSLCITVNAAG